MSALPAALAVLRDFKLAVVTGGSSGIGKRFIASMLQANPGLRVCNLSRSKPEEEKIEHFACDLADATARRAVFPRVAEWAASFSEAGRLLLINNSGFGTYGAFPEPEVCDHVGMIEVNIVALVELTGVLLPEICRRGGAIVNVASIAAFQPMPVMQTYAATKTFVVNWSVALAHELRGSGVHVQALCPGPTHTNFHVRAGFSGHVSESLSHDANAVVEASFRGLQRRKSVVIPGRLNSIVATLARILPLRSAARLAAGVLNRTRRNPEA